MSDDQTGTLWEHGWEGHAQHQRDRLAKLPLSEKLRWLEQAHHLALRLSGPVPKPKERPGD
jgi:hypothetical protein